MVDQVLGHAVDTPVFRVIGFEELHVCIDPIRRAGLMGIGQIESV